MADWLTRILESRAVEVYAMILLALSLLMPIAVLAYFIGHAL